MSDLNDLAAAYNGQIGGTCEEAIEPESYEFRGNRNNQEDITGKMSTELAGLELPANMQSFAPVMNQAPVSTYDDTESLQNFFEKFQPPSQRQQQRQPQQRQQPSQRVSYQAPQRQNLRNRIVPAVVEEQFAPVNLSTEDIIDVIDYIFNTKGVKAYIKTAVTEVVDEVLRDKIEEVVDTCIHEITGK